MENKILGTNEAEVLVLAYDRFNKIYKEVMDETFWTNNPYFRLSKIKDCFSIYTEIIKFKDFKEAMKIKLEDHSLGKTTAMQLLEIVRHILIHFPFFDSWKGVYFNKSMITWLPQHKKIDNFFSDHENQINYVYRIKRNDKVEAETVIRIPKNYTKGTNIFLNNILNEKDGIRISMVYMKKILRSLTKNIQ